MNYEEIYILNHILRSESNEISSKEIAKCSEFKPYYLTKKLYKKLKDLKLLSKKSLQDEKNSYCLCYRYTKANIQKLISELEEYIKKLNQG